MASLSTQANPIPLKPSHIDSEEDAWNYVVWYHLTHGTHDEKSPPHHPDFWAWFHQYRQANLETRQRLKKELGADKFNRSAQLMQKFFDQAKTFCHRET